jgi:hypothetical protein
VVVNRGSDGPCNKLLSCDIKSSSTKSMLSHLRNKHWLYDPEKTKSGAKELEAMFKRKSSNQGSKVCWFVFFILGARTKMPITELIKNTLVVD